MDRLIKKALKSLGISWNDNNEFQLNTEKDIDFIISSQKATLIEIECLMIQLQEGRELVEKQLDNLHQLKHQIKVERYKELNPGKDVF